MNSPGVHVMLHCADLCVVNRQALNAILPLTCLTINDINLSFQEPLSCSPSFCFPEAGDCRWAVVEIFLWTGTGETNRSDKLIEFHGEHQLDHGNVVELVYARIIVWLMSMNLWDSNLDHIIRTVINPVDLLAVWIRGFVPLTKSDFSQQPVLWQKFSDDAMSRYGEIKVSRMRATRKVFWCLTRENVILCYQGSPTAESITIVCKQIDRLEVQPLTVNSLFSNTKTAILKLRWESL